MANREPSSDQNVSPADSRRTTQILAALALILWLVLMFTLLVSDATLFYTVLGPPGLVALATWVVRTGLVKPELLRGRTVPVFTGTLTLIWLVFSTGAVSAWDLWRLWEFLSIALNFLTTGTSAGFLIRQGLLSVAHASDARSWFRVSLWLICGGLLWAVAFLALITFVFLVTM